MDERVPRDFETLRATILDRRETLPKRIAQIAAYALDNPDDIAFGTAASIAASAGVQPSTLIRFAQAHRSVPSLPHHSEAAQERHNK